jgi:hypothetical protein
MPSLNVSVDDDRAMARLEKVGPDARAALTESLKDLAETIAGDARERAQTHIRYLGLKAPGSYVESIVGGVSEKDRRIVGFVRSGHPLAHLMELGVQAHDIFPKAADVLAFEGPAGMVFARHVHDPGMHPYPAILPAFEAESDDIEGVLEAAVKHGVAE